MNGDIWIGFLIGALAREWSKYGRKGFNYLKNRPRKKKLIETVTKQLEHMKSIGRFEEYEITGFCFTCPVAHVNARMGSRKAMRGFQVISPDEDPTPPKGA